MRMNASRWRLVTTKTDRGVESVKERFLLPLLHLLVLHGSPGSIKPALSPNFFHLCHWPVPKKGKITILSNMSVMVRWWHMKVLSWTSLPSPKAKPGLHVETAMRRLHQHHLSFCSFRTLSKSLCSLPWFGHSKGSFA